MEQVRIQRTGELLVTDLRRANNCFARTRGLMLAGKLPAGAGLDINPCASIHMMFMRFPIDAVFYDRNFRVTKVVRNLRQWIGLSFGGKGARGVIELPAGTAGDVEAGDVLEFLKLEVSER